MIIEYKPTEPVTAIEEDVMLDGKRIGMMRYKHDLFANKLRYQAMLFIDCGDSAPYYAIGNGNAKDVAIDEALENGLKAAELIKINIARLKEVLV